MSAGKDDKIGKVIGLLNDGVVQIYVVSGYIVMCRSMCCVIENQVLCFLSHW